MENYKVPFEFKGQHATEAVVITCMDFRFWKAVVDFVENELGIKSFDFPNLPGVSKAFNEENTQGLSLGCVKIGEDLHCVKKVVLVDHADCGAYGGVKKFDGDIEKEQKFHEKALRQAREKILEKHPNIEVILAFAKLVDEGGAVEFVKVG